MRIGIDIGGTFTDFVAVDDAGRLSTVKEPSTHGEPMVALERGLARLARGAGTAGTSELLAGTDLIVQGTTVALNAVLERSGVPTALLATRGFRDSLEIRLGHKERRYAFRAQPPDVLVPRELRFDITERIDRRGRVRVPLDEGEVRRRAGELRRRGITSVAVSYLWSFLDPVHEIRTRELLAEELPDAVVSLSSEVWPQIREYDRTSTTVLNAYVGPLVRGYIDAVERLLHDKGFQGETRYVQSSGGLATGELLRKRPVVALNSGPAAGPSAGGFFGRRHGREHILVMDMGGTSFDVTLVADGVGLTVKHTDFHGVRVATPMIDLHTIGAGGGSIAAVDSAGLLTVGPRSAGAYPGPACYGRGGTRATVTDADVVLGYVGELRAARGQIDIDSEAANAAVRSDVADSLGLGVVEAAAGVHEVANQQMASAISVVSVERGRDPREMTAVVGGGAGPVHALALAERLGIDTVIVPRFAGALCAFGASVAPVRHDAGASYLSRWQDLHPESLSERLAGLVAEGVDDLVRAGAPPADVDVRCRLAVRYVGQIHEIPVDVPPEVGVEELRAAAERFHAAHRRLFGYADEAAAIELIDLDVVVTAQQASRLREDERTPDAGSGPHGVRSAWFDGIQDVPVYIGDRLARGFQAAGPALIDEETTTIVVRPGWTVALDGHAYRLERRAV